MHLENVLLSKIASLNPDLLTSAKPTGNGQRTGEQKWEPDPLDRQYLLISKAKDFCLLVSCLHWQPI